MKWINSKKTYRLSFLIIAPILIGYFLYLVRAILTPFILAGFFAYLIVPVVRALERRGVPRLLAIILTYASMLGLFAILTLVGFPKMLSQLNELLQAIPTYTLRVQELTRHFENNYSQYALPSGLRQIIDQRIGSAEQLLIKLISQLLDTLIQLALDLPVILLVPILAFYMLKDSEHFKHNLEAILPTKMRTDVMGLVRDLDEVLRGFLRGHVLVCTLVGLLTWIGYTLIGMPFALVLGVLSGLVDIIPFFGPLIGLVPALAIALMQSWKLALWSIGVAMIVQQLEANVISPKIFGDSLGLHPITIIFVLLAGGELWGLIGMLIAVPVAAILKVIVRFVFLKLVAA